METHKTFLGYCFFVSVLLISPLISVTQGYMYMLTTPYIQQSTPLIDEVEELALHKHWDTICTWMSA